MDKAVGRVVINGGVQISKSLDVQQGHPVVHPNLRCLVIGQHLTVGMVRWDETELLEDEAMLG